MFPKLVFVIDNGQHLEIPKVLEWLSIGIPNVLEWLFIGIPNRSCPLESEKF